MKLNLKTQLKNLREADAGFIAETRDFAKTIKVGQTAFVAASDFHSELGYKRAMAKKGRLMYHYHLCCENNEIFRRQVGQFEELLTKKNLHLDRFGISIDPAMALPRGIREANRKGGALYFETQADWDMLGMSALMQPHLGDNMIGSPACYETVTGALQAGVTTMGNMSQFFGYEYPEFTDTDARAKATLQALALMAEKRENGTLVHSNLDDGYGEVAPDLGLLIGCAKLEKYLVEDLMGAKIAHSYGDMFFSPMKRLVFLSALKKIHGDEIVGSMVFTNKLGRNHENISLNDVHLSMSLIYDMVGQYVYQTGHAVTTMANQGLTTDTTVEEVIHTLEMAKEAEMYLPAVAETIDFDKIDAQADAIVARGELFFENVLEALAEHIDVTNPYALLCALKRVGMKNLTAAFGKDSPHVIETDYTLYSH